MDAPKWRAGFSEMQLARRFSEKPHGFSEMRSKRPAIWARP
jgi:hypothetical protein